MSFVIKCFTLYLRGGVSASMTVNAYPGDLIGTVPSVILNDINGTTLLLVARATEGKWSNITATVSASKYLATTSNNAINISGTLPIAGQSLIATSSTTATWQNIIPGNININTPINAIDNNGAIISGSPQVLQLEYATSSNPGILSTSLQSISGNKIFTSSVSAPLLNITNNINQIILGSIYTTTLNAPTPGTDIVLTLPSSASDTLLARNTTDILTNKTIQGSTNIIDANNLKTTGAAVNISSSAPPLSGQVLTATSATTATWQNSSSLINLTVSAPINATDDNGIITSGANLQLEYATSSNPGILSTGSQNIAGIKTFTSSISTTSASIINTNNQITFGLAGATTILNVPAPLSNIILTLPNTGSDILIAKNTTDILTNKTLIDNTTLLANNVDNTKTLNFNLSGNTTNIKGILATQFTTNKTLTFPDITDILITKNTTDILTNKTLIDNTTLLANNVDNTKTLNFNLSGNTTNIKGILATQFTTNKTLTFPDITDILITKNTTDILTNKTITSSTNIISANNLKTTGADVNISLASPPISGQLLTATSATTAIWQGLNSLLPTTTKGDLIVNDGTNNVRLPVGSNGQIISANSSLTDGLGWVNFTSFSNPNVITVRKNPNVGQFNTVLSAVASITTSSITNRYVIIIEPGLYAESGTITIPNFVSIIGLNQTQCVLNPTGDFILFIMGQSCALSNFAIRNGGSTSYVIKISNNSNGCILDNLVLQDCAYNVYIESLLSVSRVRLNQILINPITVFPIKSFVITDNNSGFACVVISTQCTVTINGNNYGCEISGPLTNIIIRDNIFNGISNTGNGIIVYNGAVCSLASSNFINLNTAIQTGDFILNNPTINSSGGVLFANCNKDFSISNRSTMGGFEGIIEYPKTFITPFCMFQADNISLNNIIVAPKNGYYNSINAAIIAINPVFTITLTTGLTNITSAGLFTPNLDGILITGSGIPALTTATFVDFNNMTLSNAATSTGNITATFVRANQANHYSIQLNPGTFTEPSLMIPDDVSLIGIQASSCYIEPQVASATLITMGKKSELINVTIQNVSTGIGVLIDSNQNSPIDPGVNVQGCNALARPAPSSSAI